MTPGKAMATHAAWNLYALGLLGGSGGSRKAAIRIATTVFAISLAAFGASVALAVHAITAQTPLFWPGLFQVLVSIYALAASYRLMRHTRRNPQDEEATA